MRTPFTLNRLRFTMRSPFTIHNGKQKTVNNSGDTLVEVMLAIVLIGGAVALAVSMANRNLNVGIDSSQRTQALALTQGQVERIRNAYTNADPILAEYQSDQDEAFCILGDGQVELVSAQNSRCNSFNGTQYSIAITYTDATRVFSVNTTWQSNAIKAEPGRVTLSYKLPSE